MKEHDQFHPTPHGGVSPFTEIAAVDAWDAWFRWRENGALRDVTIDATWDRITSALTSVEAPDCVAGWKRRMTDAFRAWRLLPDERILATAGTAMQDWEGGRLIAVLNCDAFVRAPYTAEAVFDEAGFENVGALAVRVLDDAVQLAGADSAIHAGFRIGIIGLADAFTSLGVTFDSADARAQAALMARALAIGCNRGSLQLARERGATAVATDAWRISAQARGLPAEMVEEISRIGIRHDRLTAITAQPRLAQFANGASDMLDARTGPERSRTATGRDKRRPANRAGRFQPPQFTPSNDLSPSALALAQLKIRASIQRWIDEPIDEALAAGVETSAR